MPRRRMVKPEFFDSETLGDVSHSARLLFIGLWVFADDCGNIKASYRKLIKQIFPWDNITESQFVGLLAELESVGCIEGHDCEFGLAINIPNFTEHQIIRKPSAPVIKKLGKKVNGAFAELPVTTQCSTSDALVQNDVGLPVENSPKSPVENLGVQHQCSTSNPKVSKEVRESYISYSVGSKGESAAPSSGALSPPTDEVQGVSLHEFKAKNPGVKIPQFLERAFGGRS